jgi:hypothetical protein
VGVRILMPTPVVAIVKDSPGSPERPRDTVLLRTSRRTRPTRAVLYSGLGPCEDDSRLLQPHGLLRGAPALHRCKAQGWSWIKIDCERGALPALCGLPERPGPSLDANLSNTIAQPWPEE